jgi:hypothetical protein
VFGSRPGDHKRVDRETRPLYAVTDEVIRQHLTGNKTIGIYPLLVDETCWLLAADFDKTTWQDDSLAFLATLQTCDYSGLSGNGHDLQVPPNATVFYRCASRARSPAWQIGELLNIGRGGAI